nr:MAG TPA: Protein of unknown function (DUF2023) [Caudoviricetes sp.]
MIKLACNRQSMIASMRSTRKINVFYGSPN